ncbi:MAG: tape measure protein [Prevotellaceae bacterium]|jgi:tape measure domain-containing protein|nr:tape measure protein [Prevotellaceae bacterium]
MINQEGKIYYGLGLDNKQLQADANRAMAIIRGIGDSSVAEGAKIDNAYKKIAGSVAAVFTIQKAAEFAKSIVLVRGEIESLAISFETLLGSKEKADALFSQIRSFASNTPMELAPLAKGAQTLLSFNIEAEKVMPILRQIGDISMGNADKFNSLVLAFSQMSSTGKLMGQDLLQMINAGFNPLTIISEKTGKSISQLKDEMSAGAITVDMVADAFASAASEGGQFYGMLEKQSKGINGSISNLKGAIDDMFNDLGTKSQGAITTAIDGATLLVKHYETIGEIIAVIVATYGTYKAAIIATEAVRQSMNTVRSAEEATQLTALLTVEQQARISKLGLTKGSLKHSAAVKAEIVAEMERQTKLAISANSELDGARKKLAARRAEKIAIAETVAARQTELNAALASGNARKIATAQKSFDTAQEKLNTAAIAQNTAIKELHSKRAIIDSAVRRANTLETGLNTAAQTANITATSILAAAKLKLTDIAAKLNEVIMANPFMLAAAVVAALAYGIYKLVTYQTEAEKVQKRLNDAIKEAEKASLAETRELARLKGELSAATKGSDEYNRIKEKIVSNYGKYHKGLAEEIEKVGLLDSTYKKLTESIQASFAARQYDKFKQTESDNLDEVMSKNLGKIQDKLIDKLGDEAGSKYYAKIREAIFNGTVSIGAGFEAQGLDSKTKAALDKISGKADNDWIQNYAIEGYIKNIITAQKLTDDLDKKARVKFGIDSNPETGTEGKAKKDKQTEKYGKAYEEAKTEWEAAKKALREIEKDKDSFTKEQYENAKKREETAKKSYSDLGGAVSTSRGSTSKPKDYADQLKREKQERIREEKDLWFAVWQAEIDVMDEGLEKVLAKNELGFEKEMEQLRRQKEDKLTEIQKWERTIWESENPNWKKKGMKFTPKTTKLSGEDNEQYKTIETGIEARFTADNKNAYKDALNEYAQFAQKYLDKVDEFNNNLKKLKKKGASDEAIESVKSMQAEILAGLDEEMEIKEQTFVTFVEGMVGMGLEELLDALNQAKDALETEISSGGGDEAKVNQLKAQVKTLTARINELTAVKDDTKKVKAGDPAKKWKDTLSVMKDVKSLTNDIAGSFEGLDDATKAVLDAAMNIATGVINMIIGINTLAVGSAAATTMTATTAAEAIKGVEKASVILAIISAALQIAQAIASVITNIFSKDKKREQEIQSLQGQVDALQSSYSKLEKAIDKAYSVDAANLIRQQDDALRQRKKLLEEQIQLEEEKKKTDNGKVQQYKDAIKEIDDELEGSNDKVIDAIIGQDVKSAIDDFAEAYMDAWSAGEDKAASVKDVVRKMIKSAITELVKSRMSGEVEAFMDYLTTAMEDGILTVAEQNTLDALEAEIGNKLNGLDESLGKYVKDKENEREGASKGFASMSQDSANELNGRFTALQALTYEICMNMRILLNNSQAILLIVSGIKEDTKNLDKLENIERDIQSVKNSMSDIAIKGITIKK